MTVVEELDYLRWFYESACQQYSDGGSDEAYYIAKEYTSLTGKQPPGKYNNG